jgi:hypothetical protein
MRRKRTFLLAAVLAGAFSIALGDGNWAVTQIRKLGAKADIALLTSPVLGDRSPGGRGKGMLLSTKIQPHERVLPSVRDRVTLVGGSPIVNIDIPPGTFAPTLDTPTGESILPENLTFDGLVSRPFIDYPGSLLGGAGPLLQNATTPAQDTSPSQVSSQVTSPLGPIGDTSPPSGPSGTPPSSGPFGDPSPPPGSWGVPPGSPSPTGTVVIPEPASWTFLVFGFVMVGVASRRDLKRQRPA